MKYGLTEKYVLAAIERGHRLCKSLRHKANGEAEITYFLEPSGRKVGPIVADNAIKNGNLSPLGDGFFGPEFSQTWGKK